MMKEQTFQSLAPSVQQYQQNNLHDACWRVRLKPDLLEGASATEGTSTALCSAPQNLERRKKKKSELYSFMYSLQFISLFWLLAAMDYKFKTFEELHFNVVSRCKQEFSTVLLFTKKPYYIWIHEYVWIYGGMGDVYYLSTYFIY